MTLPSRGSKPRSEGKPVPFTLCRALPHRGALTAAAPGSGVVLGALVGPPTLFTLLRELPRRGAGGTTAPATRVTLATRVFPPLGDLLLCERPEFV